MARDRFSGKIRSIAKEEDEVRRRVASVTMAPPHDVDQMMMWRQRIASENEMCLMTAKERIAQGYDAIIANTRKAPAQVSKITPETIQRLLQPHSSAVEPPEAEGSTALPPSTRGRSSVLTTSSSYASLTSANKISFPGIEGRLASRSSFSAVGSSVLSPSKSSRTLPLLERQAQGQVSQQQIVDARWPGSWQGALSSSANLLRPSLRAAIEANSESQDRFFGGAWRHRISRTPRGEENQRYR